MQKQLAITLAGLILAAFAVYWIEPKTVGGTTFIVIIVVLVANIAGAIILAFRKPKTEKK